MKLWRVPASALFGFLLLIPGLGAAPPGRPEAQPPPLGSEHKEPGVGDIAPGPKAASAPEVRAARNSEPQEEGELFQDVDPRALAAVLLQALDRPASPPAPSASQLGGPEDPAAEALLTETVRSQTHSFPAAPEAPEPAAPPRSPTPENGAEEGDPSEELETLAALLQELRDFSPSSAKRQQETAAAETETRTHTLTRVNLESPGPERVWRASWGEFQARVPERAPLPPPAAPQFPVRVPENRPLAEAHQFGEGAPSAKLHLGEALAPLSKAYPGLSVPFPKARRPEGALLGGSEAGERLLQQGLAQVEAGRRQAEVTRQAAAQEERLADLASDLLLQYLLQGGARQRSLGGRGLQEEEEAEEKEKARGSVREEGEEEPEEEQEEEEEAEQERRGGVGRFPGDEDAEAAAEAEAEAEEAERARQNSLLFAEEDEDEDAEAGAEDKRSQEETPGHRRKVAGGAGEGGEEADDDEEEMDPQTIDSLIELSTKLHLPADDVVSIIEEVEEKRKRKKNAPPEPGPPPRAVPVPTRARAPQSPLPAPAPAPARDELPDWNEVLPPWDREEDEVFPPGPYHPFPNYIRPRTLQPPAAARRRHYHPALAPGRHYPGLEAQARRAQAAAVAEERRMQEQEEMENYIERVLLHRP
ncbi:neurosecretory protein VGF [Suncus etruscus]|uniref:neurosecretory protein VGF n=1 Tax=Suncus etruscus TaxID=109475 RepID=UPI002110BF32|nr:neurosecretory protein VGF [Suncus etruscus]